MKANYGQEIWTKGISFYLDRTGFTYKRNALDQACALKARVWRKKSEGFLQDALQRATKRELGAKY